MHLGTFGGVSRGSSSTFLIFGDLSIWASEHLGIWGWRWCVGQAAIISDRVIRCASQLPCANITVWILISFIGNVIRVISLRGSAKLQYWQQFESSLIIQGDFFFKSPLFSTKMINETAALVGSWAIIWEILNYTIPECRRRQELQDEEIVFSLLADFLLTQMRQVKES